MTGIHVQTERKRQDRSARCEEKHHRQARARRLRALIRPVPAARSTAGAAQDGKRLSGGQIHAIFKSVGTLGECRVREGDRMVFTKAWTLAVLSSFALIACQPDPQLTSVNPLLQSSESRALRQQISGSTATWSGGDNDIVQNCTLSYMFARNGSLVRQTQCRKQLKPSPYFSPAGGQSVTQRAEGSWTIRDGQLCYNFFRINGYPTTEVMQEGTCLDVKISGNQALLYDGPRVISARLVRN